MPAEGSQPQIEITPDEDWKARVKSEDAAIDQRLRAEQVADQAASSDKQPGAVPRNGHPDLPEASFDLLVAMLSTQALMGLGVVPNPVTGKPETDLPLARHFIDLVEVLQIKTAGNLSSEESEGMEQTLQQLRIGFVQRSRAST